MAVRRLTGISLKIIRRINLTARQGRSFLGSIFVSLVKRRSLSILVVFFSVVSVFCLFALPRLRRKASVPFTLLEEPPTPPVEVVAVTSFFDFGFSPDELRIQKQRLAELLVSVHRSVRVVVYTTEEYVDLMNSFGRDLDLRVGGVWEWGSLSEHREAFVQMETESAREREGGARVTAEAHAARALKHDRLPSECRDGYNGWDEKYCFWIDLDVFSESALGSDFLGPEAVQEVFRPLWSGEDSTRVLMVLEDSFPSDERVMRWHVGLGPIKAPIVSGKFLGAMGNSALGWWGGKWWALFEQYMERGLVAPSVDHFVNAMAMDTLNHIFLLDSPSHTSSHEESHQWEAQVCFVEPLSAVYQFLRDPEMRPDGCDLTHAAHRMIEYLGCREETLPGEKGDVAFTSLMTTGDPGYIEGLIALGNSIRLGIPAPTPPMVLLTLIDPSDILRVDELRGVGWTLCKVPRYPPPFENKVARGFRDQFSKLPLWSLTKYKRVVYMDADTLLLRPPWALMKATGKFAAVPDWAFTVPKPGTQDYFNMGVFSIPPSEQEFMKLNALRMTFHDYDLRMCEQAMISKLYTDKESGWEVIDFRCNGNTAMFVFDYEEWQKRWPTLEVIHFTMEKPFASSSAGRMPAVGHKADLLRLWDSFRYGERPSWLDSSPQVE